MMDSNETRQEIKALLKSKNAVLLAHNYMRDEVQEIADITGDSLALSIEAAKTAADVIVFCGVHFMAESASMLSPDKTVLLPRWQVARWLTWSAEGLLEMKARHPGFGRCLRQPAAAVKAHSDICTSANAVRVKNSFLITK
jgi:quinolinate synthase